MSFSSEIKEELVKNYAKARHCDLAELSALVRMSGAGGYFEEKNGTCILHFHTENAVPTAYLLYTTKDNLSTVIHL